jgi:hypothetical protein
VRKLPANSHSSGPTATAPVVDSTPSPAFVTPPFHPEILKRSAVCSQVVSDQSLGNESVLLQELTHQFHRGVLVSPGLDQHIENLAFVVNRAPQPELPPRNHHGQASGAGESHPRALSEPDVTLSRHPAPIVRPRPWIKLQ